MYFKKEFKIHYLKYFSIFIPIEAHYYSPYASNLLYIKLTFLKHVKHFIEGVFDICFPKPDDAEWNQLKDDPFWVKVLFLVFIGALVAFFVLMDY